MIIIIIIISKSDFPIIYQFERKIQRAEKHGIEIKETPMTVSQDFLIAVKVVHWNSLKLLGQGNNLARNAWLYHFFLCFSCGCFFFVPRCCP